eukprot:CAMPEP_0201534590 /NCGR_PEP_ID=MMETSP0161_2-20130828/56740_1 /ASSEMBLY_ACC=CAM_ASM_000251 /TAXON_ID=180227 /ORGANISM="Neoparamoeba aestuarina, Strain SoJaBio B1-5/56/2" /LENGTH=61 /DNA_ID=CAMNT_0047939317 /DNA_START=69 /DNA_END=251 /DNA_ORIENTATION=+
MALFASGTRQMMVSVLHMDDLEKGFEIENGDFQAASLYALKRLDERRKKEKEEKEKEKGKE